MSGKDILYFEGIDDLLLAPMTTRDSVQVTPVYGEVTQLPILTKVGISGNGSTLEKWASSKMFRRVSRETKHEVALDHVGFPIDLWDELNGVKPVKGVVFNKALAKEYPYWAMGFTGRIENGGRMAVWYPKVQLSNVISEEYVTAEEETQINDVTANFTATGLLNNDVLHVSYNSTRATADGITLETFTKQPVFDETQWGQLATGSGGAKNG